MNTEITEKIQRTMLALSKNNIDSILVKNKEDAVEFVKGLVPKGAVVSCGGSVSLRETGVLGLMKSGYYTFLNRDAQNSPEAVREIYLKTFNADAFFTSANAITENGELYNVDGNANRVAAIAYGPKQVIVIAGENKIVKDLDAAIHRVKTVAAPKNGIRLDAGTPCALTGECSAVNGGMTAGCKSERRMCAEYLVTGFQRQKGRITVVFIPEDIGY